MSEEAIPRCPLCNHRLYEYKCGDVCKNWKCKLYWKLGGWCLKEIGIWEYTDPVLDKRNKWNIKHGYPLKSGIIKRHVKGMCAALAENEDLCFAIPLRYCLKVNEHGEIISDVQGGDVQWL